MADAEDPRSRTLSHLFKGGGMMAEPKRRPMKVVAVLEPDENVALFEGKAIIISKDKEPRILELDKDG